MKRAWSVMAAAIAAGHGIGASECGAQTIEARLNGSAVTVTTASNGDIEIDVGSFPSSSVLHIFDSGTSSGVPTLSAGLISIAGTPPSVQPGELRVLIASAGASWPIDSTTPLDEGLINLGNLSTGGIQFGSTALRDTSIVAVAVSGNIAGDIDVGRVFRIQANGVTGSGGSITGGEISSNITAHAPDIDLNSNGVFSLGELSINFIAAGDLFSGSIIAGDDSSPATDTGYSIGRVSVGPSTSARGIR